MPSPIFSARLRKADQAALSELSGRTGLQGPTELLRHLLHRPALAGDVVELLLGLLDSWKPRLITEAKLKARAVDALQEMKGTD